MTLSGSPFDRNGHLIHILAESIKKVLFCTIQTDIYYHVLHTWKGVCPVDVPIIEPKSCAKLTPFAKSHAHRKILEFDEIGLGDI
jgi:hypothetical protein